MQLNSWLERIQSQWFHKAIRLNRRSRRHQSPRGCEILEQRLVPTQISLSIKSVQNGAAGTWDLQMPGFSANSDVLARTNSNGVLEISGRPANVQVAGRTIGLRADDITQLAIVVDGEVKTIDLRGIHASDFKQLARPGAFSIDGFDVSVYDKDGSNEIFGTNDPLILDRLEGGAGKDTIHGGQGDDFINGGSGKDSLYGGEGNDLLLGDLYAKNAFVDHLEGNAGDDTLRWGGDDLGGVDELIGGDGADTFEFQGVGDAINKTASGTTLTVDRDANDIFNFVTGSWTNASAEIAGQRIYDKVTQGNVTVKVLSLNTPPDLAEITSQTTLEDVSAKVNLSINDAQTPVGNLKLTVTSSNATLLPNDRIDLSGTGNTRTLTLRPADNQSGKTTLTVTLSDGSVQVSRSFELNVTPVNDAPKISSIAATSIDQDSVSTSLPFRISDVETATSKLKVTAVSSNQALIPNKSVVLGGSNADRTIQVTPVADQFGQATITIKVSDGEKETVQTFDVTVNRVVRDLKIDLAGGQGLTMKATSGKVVVLIDNVAVPQYANILAKHVRSIVINGGTGNNKIDLSGVTITDYKNLFQDFKTGMTHEQAKFGIEVHGNAGDDTITGSALADDLYGDDGKDSLIGGKGSDKLVGGLNNDTLFGGDDNDQLRGEVGLDSLIGGTGDDSLEGGADDDYLQGDTGKDTLDGGDGRDSLLGGKDNDSLIGGTGNDTLNGGANDDTLMGGIGDDALSGFDGNDSLEGSDGQDTLIGGKGSDKLYGGSGDDLLRGDLGADVVDGQDGQDTALTAGAVRADVVVGATTEVINSVLAFTANWIDRV